jgi:hypothetical protein
VIGSLKFSFRLLAGCPQLRVLKISWLMKPKIEIVKLLFESIIHVSKVDLKVRFEEYRAVDFINLFIKYGKPLFDLLEFFKEEKKNA